MTNSPLPFERMPGESDFLWEQRIRSHIVKNAPKEHRYFVRNGKPGTKGQKWFIPGMIFALAIFFAYGGYAIGTDVRTLNGPNGTQGRFTVEALQKKHTKQAEEPKYLPVVTIRGEQIVPLFSKPGSNTYKVGDTVTLRYSRTGDVAAAFVNDSGNVSNGGSIALWIIAAVAGSIAVLVAKFYRGAVDSNYVDSELVRLIGADNPSNRQR